MGLLVIVLLVSWLKFLPLVRLVGQEAWGARYDHDHAREFIKKIPNRAIVLSHIPTMFLLWGQNAIQTFAGINNPEIILADEPTGNLDPETSEGIISLLFDISKTGRAVLMATHNYTFFQKFPARTLRCENGNILESN